MSADVALKTYEEAVPAFDANDPRLKRLHELIDQQSLMRGTFTLSSGRDSNYLFQLRQTTVHPEGSSLIGEIVVEFMQFHNVHCVGGLELGAVPMVTSISTMSHQLGYRVSPFFVRKEAKKHGAKELLDGHISAGDDVLVVDDVTTTGASTLRAVEPIIKRGCKVNKALSIVDREEGAAELLSQHGITLYSLFKRSDFKIG